MKISPLGLIVAWLVFGTTHASAALTLSLDAPVVNAAAGVSVVFNGTLTNNDATKVFLNDLQVSLPTGLALKPNTFYANVPGILLPGESYTGAIFSVALGTAASPGDYICTVAMKGGAGMVASDALATAGFTVLSPAVTIAATIPNASEFGPVSGAFTVTRTGGTAIPLTVPFTIGGTAVNGSACATIAPSVVIPSGASSANVAVVPIPNNVAEGNRTVALTLAVSNSFNIGANAAATVTIHDKPADEWRVLNFAAAAGTAAASDAGDWDRDGLSNLLEYGLSLNPKVGDVSASPRAMLVDGYLTLSFVPNPGATDLLYVVEGSANLASWSTADVDLVILANPVPPTRRTFRYHAPIGTVGKAYLRLRIDRLP